MNAFELLSEIYRLIGNLDESTIREARRISDSPRVAEILDALLAASHKTPERIEPAINGRQSPNEHFELSRGDRWEVSERTAIEDSPESVRLKKQTEKSEADIGSITSVLSSRSLSVDDLRRLSKHLGLRLRPKPKESKARLAARISGAIAEMPPSKRRATIRGLRKSLGIDETEGWIEVIRAQRTYE